jgi:asparagine synthase (glutamine-hydrolysing)
MCGVNGYVLRTGAVDSRLVESMNAALQHRGPDEGGVIDAGNACLGMRRLSIMDLARGHQPMHSPGGRHTLVYNGELYDHDTMRDDLVRRGHRFRTSSDTEVLLEAWTSKGLDCLEELNGMFAFAVYDRDENHLTLVRDPLGIKPLYYWHAPDGELVFSSELGSLLEHPRVPRQLDHRSLAMLLVDRCVADPWTMLEGVHQLPPGHWLRWKDGQIEVRRYWRMAIQPEAMGEVAAAEELRQLLDDSVRSQLVADVPVGVFLSGGIDSSTIAAYAKRCSEGPLHSFNVGFANSEFDESSIARQVAQHLGTEHHELRIQDASFDPGLLDSIVRHVGQPLGDLSCIPTWIVSRSAREHVKVVLSGDGGDELFGGYDHIRWAARVQRVSQQTPALLRRLGGAVLAGVAPVTRGTTLERTRRARKGLELTFCEPLEQVRRMMSLWSEEEARSLICSGKAFSLPSAFHGDPATLDGLEPEDFAMAVLGQSYMTSAILAKVDRMSMANSLEVRVPLLDKRIVEFAMRCPLDLKIRGRQGKFLLRKAGQSLLPEVVYSHPKKGFGIPMQDWFNGDFWDLMDELYRPEKPVASLFNQQELERTIADGRRSESQVARVSSQAACARVWLLAQLGHWMETFEVAA